jgi:NAD(P)-dependent dehydrogenase (short-subunit alcohol dehydrogenase family)
MMNRLRHGRMISAVDASSGEHVAHDLAAAVGAPACERGRSPDVSHELFAVRGKVVLVTGAASGIGRVVAVRLASAGAELVLADVVDASTVAEEVGGTFVLCDVSREDQVAAAMDAVIERHGHLDVLVNNAGVAVSDRAVTHDTDAAYLRAFRVNTLGAVHGIRQAVPLMGGGGSIVNVASLSALIGAPLLGAYAASKAALLEVTRTSALELVHRGIRVNAVAPSAVTTPMYDGNDQALRRERAWIAAAGPTSRAADPDEVAAVVHFLASDDSRMITGQTIVVDGGLSAGPSLAMLDALVAGDDAPGWSDSGS